MSPEQAGLYTYRQVDSVKLECTIDLDMLYPNKSARLKFNENWRAFLKSCSNHKRIFRQEKNRLLYFSEQLISEKIDSRPPLLLVFGNPATHSIETGMFFSYEGNGREHRFWKDILKPANVLELKHDSGLTLEELNTSRKKQLLSLDYNSRFRIGLCVFISMPSASNGPWSGIAGVQKLLGARAMQRLEIEERKRVIESASRFLSPEGIIVTFQKNAWQGLKSDNDPSYSLELARQGRLKGRLSGMPHIPLLGVPPTRQSGPCSCVLKNIFKVRGNKG